MKNTPKVDYDRQKLLANLLEKFSITQKEIEEHQNLYNADYSRYGNEIYHDIKTRIVHLLNFWENERLWINGRLDILKEIYREYEVVVDFGYSLPYLQLLAAETGEKGLPHCIYVDSEPSAKLVSEAILEYLGMQAQFVIGDMQSLKTFEELLPQTKGKKTLLVSLEAIEHLEQPERFWEGLKLFQGLDALVSLPVGPQIPSHNLIFKDQSAVDNYVAQFIAARRQSEAEGSDQTNKDGQFSVRVVLGAVK